MAFIGNTNTTQGFTPAIDYFSGNGSTTAFTLSRPVASVAQVQAVVNNVAQNPSDAFTVSGNTITFTSAPSSVTNNIYVYYTSPITQVIAPSQGTVGTTQLQNGLTVNFADGTAAAPSITNDGDTNTGIFFPAADTIAVSTNGSERVRIDTAGITKFRSTGSAYDSTPGDGVSDGLYLQVDSSGIAHIDGYAGGGSTNLAFGTNSGGGAVVERMRIDSSGNLLFNSGYGSVAVAYGCRAWVNFNGTGTVAIRASGNVTSITDNGTGDYTVNFTTAMTDANYSVVCTTSLESGQGSARIMCINLNTAMSTTAVRTQVSNDSGTPDDKSVNCVSIFR